LVTEKRNVQVNEVVGRQGGGAPTVLENRLFKKKKKGSAIVAHELRSGFKNPFIQ
jgi:hypothetical protein